MHPLDWILGSASLPTIFFISTDNQNDMNDEADVLSMGRRTLLSS